MITNWRTWGSILDTLEDHGERRVSDDDIEAALRNTTKSSAGIRPVFEVANELSDWCRGWGGPSLNSEVWCQ